MAWMVSFIACLKKSKPMNSIAPTSSLTRKPLALRLNLVGKYSTRPGHFTNIINRFKTVWVASLLLAQISITTIAQASDEIRIIRVSDYQQEQQLRLDSESRFNLPKAVIKAINHEIPLSFTTEIVLSEQNRRFGFEFERTRASIKYQTRLYKTGVDHRYELYNSRNHKLQSFQTLEAALLTLGTLQDFPIIKLSELHPKQRYALKMRISLDHWKLPSPLLIEALFKNHWQLSSDWYEVSIQTPGSWL